MQVYHNLEEVPFIGNAVLTIGNFDGVHLGHAHILKSLVDQEYDGLQSMVITMWPHPRKVLNPDLEGLRFLTSIEEKITLLKNIGIDHLLIIPFTKTFSELTALSFVQNILHDKIGVKKIVLGYDHCFGKNREGDLTFLSNYTHIFKYKLQEIPKQEVDSLAISSSEIRKYLESGQLSEAKALLGRNYSLSGLVVEGNKLGRTIGFPTANISLLFEEKLIPKNGVYAVFVHIGEKQFKGMMNIGYRPTVLGNSLSIEVNIFDFSQDIYGQTISIEFVHYLREEQKFSSLEALKKQLQTDKKNATTILA
jgi:riboflavin kinase / FMN adenylyltransferase